MKTPFIKILIIGTTFLCFTFSGGISFDEKQGNMNSVSFVDPPLEINPLQTELARAEEARKQEELARAEEARKQEELARAEEARIQQQQALAAQARAEAEARAAAKIVPKTPVHATTTTS